MDEHEARTTESQKKAKTGSEPGRLWLHKAANLQSSWVTAYDASLRWALRAIVCVREAHGEKLDLYIELIKKFH